MLELQSPPRRISMLDGKTDIRHGADVCLRVLSPAARFVLRLDAAGLERVPSAAAMTLAQPINYYSSSNGRTSVRLGPDEWLLLLPAAETQIVATELQHALTGQHHALIDIGHRNIGLELVGTAAADVLNSGCPLDLGSRWFPVGRGTRTLLGKAEIVLLRLPDLTSPSGATLSAYRIECWRSFGRYVHGFLEQAARQYATT